MESDKMLKKIIDLFKKIDKQTELDASIINTKCNSTVIIYSDTEAMYEEVITIDGDEVHIISEGVDYTKLTIDNFYDILKENWSYIQHRSKNIKQETRY